MQAVIASASVPFAFPPQEMDGHTLIDGSTWSGVSLGDPIERCRDMGVADQNIILDVINCYEDDYSIKKWEL